VTGSDFDSFFRERFSRTVVLLIAMGASKADAEDAAQESMVLAWRQWETIHEPVAWVRTVAVRAYWKLARTRQQFVPLDESSSEAAESSDLGIFAEEEQQVLRLLRALPPQQRTVIALFYDGMGCEEIAALAGNSPATVRSHLRHARGRLKELVTPSP
jgi:RNA polymerase sigma factor (sigma-70 family)